MGQSGSLPKSSECCSSPSQQQQQQPEQFQKQQQVFPMMMNYNNNNNRAICPNEQFSNCHRPTNICPICSKPRVQPMNNCFFNNQMNMNGIYQCMNPNLSADCGGMPCWNRNRNNCCLNNNQQDQPEIKFFYPKCHQSKK